MPENRMDDGGRGQQPREKMLLTGPQELSAVELIAVLLGSGVQGHTVHKAAQALLELVQGDLSVLSSIPPLGMTEVPGIGRTKALQLSAALELGRRRQMTAQPHDTFIRSSADVFNRFAIRLSDLGHEEFWLVLLRRSNAVMAEVMVSKGGLTGTVADPKLIFSKALAMRAAGIIAVHNHPSPATSVQADPTERTHKKPSMGGQNVGLPVARPLDCFPQPLL